MAASLSVSLWSRIWESSSKLSKILATAKHYKKTFLMKQLLVLQNLGLKRKRLSRHRLLVSIITTASSSADTFLFLYFLQILVLVYRLLLDLTFLYIEKKFFYNDLHICWFWHCLCIVHISLLVSPHIHIFL